VRAESGCLEAGRLQGPFVLGNGDTPLVIPPEMTSRSEQTDSIGIWPGRAPGSFDRMRTAYLANAWVEFPTGGLSLLGERAGLLSYKESDDQLLSGKSPLATWTCCLPIKR
jgi:hypothetical protein